MRTTGELVPVLLFDSTVENETKYSAVQPLSHAFGYSVQIVYTGSSLAGTHSLQTSLDNIDWVEITGSSVTLTASGGDFVYNVTDCMYPRVRVKFVSTDTDTATVKIYSCVKGF